MVIEGGQTTLFFGTWYRKSPFFDAARRAGCYAYDVYNKMYIPSNFADPVEEYWHLVNAVTIWDVGCERQVEIRGPDGYEFMEYLTPRDLSTCKVGQAKYVVLTDEQGGLVNDPVLTRLGRTGSGSPRRTATCSCGPKGSHTTRTSTSSLASRMFRRCKSRARNRSRCSGRSWARACWISNIIISWRRRSMASRYS